MKGRRHLAIGAVAVVLLGAASTLAAGTPDR